MPARHGGGVAFVRRGTTTTDRGLPFQAYTAEGKEPDISIAVRIPGKPVADGRDQPFRLELDIGEKARQLLLEIAGLHPTDIQDGSGRSLAEAVADQVQLYEPLIDPDTITMEEPDPDALKAVAEAMTSGNHVEPKDSTDIPAVMTYFGQFLAHDLSHMQWSDAANAWINMRPGHSLDFGTVLGKTTPQDPQNSTWTCLDCTCLGETTQQGDHRDLPRISDPNGKACTPDARNDSNLALAQIFVLLTRFHHAVCQENPEASHDELQELTARHLQAVVFFDYLRTIADDTVWQDVHDNGRSLVWTDTDAPFFVPIEFAAAGFRFGHSMVRDLYADWGDETQFMGAGTLLRFVHDPPGLSSDLGSDGRLGSMWAHDWRSFSRLAPAAHMVRAARIDPNIAHAFRDLASGHFAMKPSAQTAATLNLAHRTLGRQYALRLPTGQQLAQLAGEAVMSETEILGTGYADIAAAATAAGFGTAAPLWFYILREAELWHGGGRLGPLGSRIVCETLHAAIENSPDSILKRTDGHPPVVDFTPTLPRVTSSGLFTIEDVIALAYPTP